MTYIDYMNQLWRSSLDEPMPSSEIALYAFIVNECNIRYWKMPVQCSSVRICETLRISKQTLMVAREHLRQRGLIDFASGKSRFVPSSYSLLELTDNLTVRQTLHLTNGMTPLKDKEKSICNKVISTTSRTYDYSNGNKQSQRRGIEAMPAMPSDYEGAF